MNGLINDGHNFLNFFAGERDNKKKRGNFGAHVV